MFIWAFNTLSEERDFSEKQGKRIIVHRITRRAIREWAEFYGYAGDGEFMFELVTYIRALDAVWVELEVKRLQKDKPDA